MKKLGLSQVKMGALISYFTLAVNILLGLLYTPWMVAKIGQSSYGLYTLATSVISIFMLDFGLGSAVSRFVSKYRAENNPEGIRNILGLIYKLYLAIDLLILVALTVVYFLLDVIYVKLTPAELDQFRILYLMVAGFNLVSFPLSPLNGVLNANEKFIQLKLCDLLNKVSTVVFVVLALTQSASVVWVVAGTIASNLLTIAVKFCIMRATVPVRANLRAADRSLYKVLFGFTVWTTVISIMQRFTHSFAPSVLGMTASSIEIAIYSPAVTLEGYYYLIATAVNGLFLPRVSRFIADKREDEVQSLLVKVGRYQLLVLGLLFTGFVAIGEDFMILWMGPDYARTYLCGVLLLFPTLFGSAQQIADTTVIAKNLIRYKAICMIVTGVLGLALSYVLSIYIGALGVCIGTAATALANTLYMNIAVHKRHAGLDIWGFYKKGYLRAFPVYIATAAVGILFVRRIPLGGWTGFLVKAAVICVVYAVLMFVFFLNKAERRKILSFHRK